MEINKLYSIAESEGVTVDFINIPVAKAMALKLYGKTFLAIDKDVRSGSAEERVLLAHELGHIQTDSCYGLSSPNSARRLCERQADRWAIKALVPFGELLKAYKNGNETVQALAETFGVTEEFMQKALEFYCYRTYA